MKKIVFVLTAFIAGLQNYHAQTADPFLCGTDEVMLAHYQKFPEDKARADAFNLELSQLIKSGKIDASINKNQVYEIPIVVHVVGDGSAIGTANNKSDADIIAWINYTNDVFASQASAGMAATSAVLPVKFVFAKIKPDCTPTNGINRINAAHLPKYVSGGVNSDNTTNAVTASQITALGMWDTYKYYNIYVVKRLASNSGLLNGFAYYPGGSIDYSFMSSSAASVNAQTMAHEFGHALGLRHTHEGFNSNTGACPANTDCTLDGDLVCDTEPIKSLYHSSVPYTCQAGQVNPCTGVTYAGGEKNIMSYTYCFRDRFTTGQITRAIAQLLRYRQSLIDSPVANSTPVNNSATLVNACTPSSITTPGNFNIGITSVKFGDINNHSLNYKQNANNFYENFVNNYCLGVSKTSIPKGSPTTLTVYPGTNNAHIIKVYIDYNNDGQFHETSELVMNRSNILYSTGATVQVTPPTTAIINTPLRMRVIGDYSGTSITACYTPVYGQVEDYTVIITSNMNTSEVTKENAIITKSENFVWIKSDSNISTVEIYDASGKLVTKKNNIRTKEFSQEIAVKNQLLVVNVALENGETYQQKLKF